MYRYMLPVLNVSMGLLPALPHATPFKRSIFRPMSAYSSAPNSRTPVAKYCLKTQPSLDVFPDLRGSLATRIAKGLPTYNAVRTTLFCSVYPFKRRTADTRLCAAVSSLICLFDTDAASA